MLSAENEITHKTRWRGVDNRDKQSKAAIGYFISPSAPTTTKCLIGRLLLGHDESREKEPKRFEKDNIERHRGRRRGEVERNDGQEGEG